MRDKPDADPEIYAAIRLGLFYHEIGHATDFEQGLNMALNKRLDVEAAEAFAHHFACRKLVKGNHRLSLGQYLRDFLPQLADSPIKPVRGAANGVLRSAEFRDYRKAVGPFWDAWNPS